MLTKYGTSNIVVMLTVSAAFIVAAYFIYKSNIWGSQWITYFLGALGLALAFFTFWFFRDPDRTVPEKALSNQSYIVSPADGRVVEIKDTKENIYLNSDAVQISIFLSPLDVHVNRSPVTGLIEYFEYCPGDYLIAHYPKASELNEQTHIGVKTKFGKVFFKQIVGILARRLVWDIDKGDSLITGQKFGMMKFGSRMDILVAPDTEIFIKVNDIVIAGETIVAKMKTPE